MLKQAALDETQEVKLGKRDNLQYRPNVDMLAEEAESSDGEEFEEKSEEGFEYGDEDESEIEEDIAKPIKSKKKVEREDSSDSEKPAKKGVYKANKMNPIMYKDTVDKSTKKIQREETV